MQGVNPYRCCGCLGCPARRESWTGVTPGVSCSYFELLMGHHKRTIVVRVVSVL